MGIRTHLNNSIHVKIIDVKLVVRTTITKAQEAFVISLRLSEDLCMYWISFSVDTDLCYMFRDIVSGITMKTVD